MKLTDLELPGPKLIGSEIYNVSRNCSTFYLGKDFSDLGINTRFYQDS